MKAYIGVLAISFAAFVLNTSEFVPIGILSLIANDFGIGERESGLLITIYAWVVALASLPLMLTFSKMELKKLLLGVILVFAIAHIISFISTNYTTLMISRIIVALSHAIFWSIATPMAVKAAPKGKESLALSMVVSGSAIAFVAGLPIGRTIGLYLGWRVTFLCIGIVAFLVFFAILKTFPKMPSAGAIKLRDMPEILKTPNLITIYIITATIITAHFTAYSYIEPFFAQIAHFSNQVITIMLSLYGIMGFVSSVIFTKYYKKNEKIFPYIALFGIMLSLILLAVSAKNPIALVSLCIVWSLCIMLFALTFQSLVINSVTKGTPVAMSMFSGIYNIGIGGGAFVGGIVVERASIGLIGYAGGAIALLSVIYFLIRPIKSSQQH